MHAYHAHIYFSANQTEIANAVREDFLNSLSDLSYVGNLIPFPIGPHTQPMFEIHIPQAKLETMTAAIDQMRRGLSVLIHPVQGNQLDAHTVAAKWLGQQLPLNLSVL